jgi:hypothetical protein
MLTALVLLLQAAAPEPVARPGDAKALASALGIPVAEAEARMRIADRLGIFQLRARSDPDFAGAYLEHEPRVQAVVLFRGDAAAKLARYGTAGEGFAARSVTYSLADLAAARREAEKAFKSAGLSPVRIGIDVEANRVVARFVDTARAARLRLPAAVALETVEGEAARAPQRAGAVTHFPQARDVAEASMQALASGTLFERGGCLRIGDPAGASYLVLWPATARLIEEGGRLFVASGGGERLAVGARATLSGGETSAMAPPGWLLEPVTDRCEGPYWIASESW